MQKLISFSLIFSTALWAGVSYASEQAELDQALKQLVSAQQALMRADKASRQTHIKNRVYFDYKQAHDDIYLIKQGIERYINSNRAQPRDPRLMRGLSGDYDRVRTN